mmetsp:Transcript_29069/g.84071  ORF Transcript_29069/g.84071 Transcript_29069/m.84071 type:complete len:228 (+) Transcript_29069:1237-1920(+)
MVPRYVPNTPSGISPNMLRTGNASGWSPSEGHLMSGLSTGSLAICAISPSNTTLNKPLSPSPLHILPLPLGIVSPGPTPLSLLSLLVACCLTTGRLPSRRLVYSAGGGRTAADVAPPVAGGCGMPICSIICCCWSTLAACSMLALGGRGMPAAAADAAMAWCSSCMCCICCTWLSRCAGMVAEVGGPPGWPWPPIWMAAVGGYMTTAGGPPGMAAVAVALGGGEPAG